MSMFSDLLMGTDASTKQYSTLSSSQQPVANQLGSQISSGLTNGVAGYTGKLVADMPSLFSEAYKSLTGSVNNYNDIIQKSLIGQASGVPAYSYDPGAIAKSWSDTYATPVMSTWRNTVAPLIAEGYNAVPGMAYSAARGKGIEQGANSFYAENVAPSLYNAQQTAQGYAFQSGENAASRQLSATQALANYPYSQFSNAASAASTMQQANQMPLTAQYNEWLRTQPQNSPWLQAGMNYLNTNQVSTVYQPETTGMLQQGLGSLMGQGMMSGISGLMGGSGAVTTGGLGGMMSGAGAGLASGIGGLVSGAGGAAAAGGAGLMSLLALI